MPGDSGVTVVTTLVCSFYFACEAAGASSARHSLRPLNWRAGVSRQNSRETRGEIAKLRLKMPRRHCEERLVRRSSTSHPSAVARRAKVEGGSDEAIHSSYTWRDGLLRGACHRARIRATRWLAMTV